MRAVVYTHCEILKNTVIFGSFYRIHYPVAQSVPNRFIRVHR